MNKLEVMVGAELVIHAREGYNPNRTGLHNEFFGKLIGEGLPLDEIKLLEPIADDIRNFTYSCTQYDVPQYQRRIGYDTSKGIAAPILETVGWKVVRTYLTVFRSTESDIYDEQEKYLYVNSDNIVRMRDSFNLYHPEAELDKNVILSSMASFLAQRKLRPLRHP